MLYDVLPMLIVLLSSGGDTTRICLAPASVEASVGDATTAANAVRDAFTSFLTGPSLRPQSLSARLASQVREEARQATCPYLLLTTFKHEHKRSGGGVLGRMAAGAAQQGAWEAGVTSGSAAGRIAGQAAYGAAGQAAYNYAFAVHNNDQLTLGYRLETSDGKVVVEQQVKRKAKSDGEDVLTPLVQQGAETIVAAIARQHS
ncbi:MAG TPA: hypothetical protein VFW66_08010 [Gemmatimonadales bacterium]|nr:hypothetical protein [Gemmatimonadales bacterium]